MAQKYQQPSLCNYHCANQCPIRQQYVPEVKIKYLSPIVPEMLATGAIDPELYRTYKES